jgi:acylphosphatase
MQMRLTRHLFITGRVQGVGFRLYMQQQARKAAIIGWVRNRQDGTVEAVVQGAPDAVEKITEWARHGPPGATVTDIQIADGTGEYETFETRPTA